MMKKRIVSILWLLFFICSLQNVAAQTSTIVYQYWIDNDIENAVTSIADNEALNLHISVADLHEGVHFYNARIQDENGVWGTVVRKLFAVPTPKVPSNTSQLQKYEYWIDNDYANRVTISATGDEYAPSQNIDVSNLSPGIHFYNARIQDENGVWGTVSRQLFCIPMLNQQRPKQITGYRYIVDSEVTEVLLQNPVDEYELDDMIDVSKVVTPSVIDDSFHFEFTDSVTTLMRSTNFSFSISFCDQSDTWSAPFIQNFNLVDTLSEQTLGMAVPGVVTLPVRLTGGFNAVKLSIPTTSTYVLKSAGNCNLCLYLPDGTLLDDCDSTVLKTGFSHEFVEGTYYAVIYGNQDEVMLTAKEDLPEPYAVLSDNNTVLTFYYDEKRNERNGIAIGSYGPGNYEPWYENRMTLTTAVFDESFANDTTLTSTAYWFFECIRMTEIKGLEYLKTDKVTDMRNMFYGCSKLTTLDVSHLKTDNVTNMKLMFYYCSGLTSLDVTGFNTENVTDMGSMFNNCSGLTSLDISSFRTEKVKDMIQMFYQCYNLTTIYAGNGWSTASVTADYGYHMFTDCTALVGGRGTTYDANHIDYTYAHIDGGSNNPGYFTDKNASDLKDGDTFTAVNSDGVELRYMVVSAADKTCQVGDKPDSNIISSKDVATAVDTSYVGTIRIPEEAMGYRVVKVGFEAFYNCRHVTLIEMPNSVSMVTLAAFENSGITEITIPSSVTYFDGHSLGGCKNLKSIVVDSQNPVYDSRNGCNAIIRTSSNTLVRGCATTKLTEKDGIIAIGAGAFLGCKGQEWSMVLPNTIISIETQAFNSCDLTAITLPSSLQTIGSYVFSGSKILSLVVPASVTDIGKGSFHTSTMTSLVVDADNATFDSRDNCNAIIETATNKLVCGISTSVIPESVTTIGTYAFDELYNLKSVTLPASISKIEDRAFWCSGLKSITSLIENPFDISEMTFDTNLYNTCELRVPVGTSDVYRSTPYWSHFTNIVEMAPAIEATFDSNGVLTVGSETTLPDALEAVGGRAEVAKTITAIVWNSTATLTNDDLQGLDNPNMLIYVKEAASAPTNRDNVVIGDLAKNIVLTDVTEGNNDFYCPQAFTAEAISYTREFNQETMIGVSRGWEAIALPFDVQTILHEKQDMISPFSRNDNNKHFWLRRLSSSGLVAADKMEANVPYIISMPNCSEYPAEFNLPGRVTFSSANVTVPVTETRTLALADSTIVMASTMQRLNRSSRYYALNVGEVRGQYLEGSVFERDYREVRPFEAYTIHRGDTPAPRFVPIKVLNGGTTGIEDVRGLMSDDRGENWYDLNGRRLQSKPSQKGVYLHDGRKVVIR